MKRTVQLASILMAAMFAPPSATSAGAGVLCQKRSGVVVVRTECIYCGTSAGRWDGNDPQLEFWRDHLGEIRIRGTARMFGGSPPGEVIFHLPAGSRPAESHAFSVTVATTGASLDGIATVFIDPDGRVRVLNATEPAFNILYFGDIHFRTDG